MTTAQKLERYEVALEDWAWRVKAWGSIRRGNLDNTCPKEPSLQGAGLTEGLEVWAANKIRSKYVQPAKNATAAAQS